MAASLASSMASLQLCSNALGQSSTRSYPAQIPVPASFGPIQKPSVTLAGTGFFGNSSQLQARISSKPSFVRATPAITAVAEVEEFVEEERARKGAKAVLSRIRMSSTKVRRVVNQVRGRTYEDALMILEFMPYRACDPVLQVVTSAAANAVQNLKLSKADLYISEVFVNQGPTLKRFQPRAQGRGFPIRKRTCIVEVTVKSKAVEPTEE